LPSMTRVLFPIPKFMCMSCCYYTFKEIEKYGIWYQGGLQWYNVNVT
jgi:hypothetical protein